VQTIFAEGVPTEILGLLWSKQDPSSGLFPTDETPADDEVEYPFHLSNQILLWYTLTRMARLLKEVGEPRGLRVRDLEDHAKQLRLAVFNHFVVPRPADDEQFFAYLCDGKGNRRLYHDANDLPTLLAVKWGFVELAPEINIWKNTMGFGFSSANEKGYFGGGPFAGLGSVHTPNPWPLGYFQEFMYAHMMGDKGAQEDASRRIQNAMSFDGTFPEAVDAETGTITSKAWFSWPGCMIASALIPSLKEREQIKMSRA
jgi:meiotically up-regulated gene 157 (Mug157) protein